MTALTAAIGFTDTEEGRTYKAWLIPEDGLTDGDDRLFVGPIEWRAERIPLTFSDVEGEPHEEARHVGNLDNLRREMREGESWVVADVDWDTDELAQEAKRLVDEDRLRGISVHPTEGEAWMVCGVPDNPTATSIEALAQEFDMDTCERPIMAFTNVVIGAATLLMLPAFEDAEVITAAVGTVHDYPMADRARAWDARAADRRWRAFTESTEAPSATYRNGFLWWSGEGETFGDYKLQVVDVIDGRAHYVPRAIFATAGGRGVDRADIPDADKMRVKSAICRLYEMIEDGPECPFMEEMAAAATAALPMLDMEGVPLTYNIAVSNPTLSYNVADFGSSLGFAVTAADIPRPPAEWFTDPKLDGPTPLTVTDDGRVFGHLALWNTCHRGFNDVCITPPPDATDYAEFHDNARQLLDTGELIGVGCLTFDVEHADVRWSAAAAKRHYDHSATVGAYVRAGNDEHGVWVAGATRYGLSDEDREKLRQLSLSGDWRPKGSKYFLLAAQAVPVPGFPIRARVASGEQVSLTTVGPAQPEPFEAVNDLALVASAVELLSNQVQRLRDELAADRRRREYEEARAILRAEG